MTGPNKPRRCLAPAFATLSAAVFMVAGCASASIEDAVPKGALSQSTTAQQPVAPAAPTDPVAPATSKTFPNIGMPAQAATQQLTPADEKSIMTELNAAKASQGKNTVSTADTTAKVKKLQEEAKRQVDQTLTTIEKE